MTPEDDSLGAGSLSFDRIADQYDATRGYPPGVSAAIAEGMALRGPVPGGANALEIGVGSGRIALPLLERGVNITGVDISARMTNILRAKYDAARAAQPELPWGTLTVTLADSARLPLSSGTFDAVIAVHVLHLISGWRSALAESLRVLRAGAPLLLGQDMSHGAPISHPMQDEWVTICHDLGYDPKRPGARGFAEILGEARSQGLNVEEWTLVSWTATHTPASAFADIAERLWSLTWEVPDPIFAASVARLGAWARGRYGDRWNDPVEVAFSFRLARITRPAG